MDCVFVASKYDVHGEREFFFDNLLVRIHRCFRWTVLAPWEFEFPFPGSLISTFLNPGCDGQGCVQEIHLLSSGGQPLESGKAARSGYTNNRV